METFDADGDGQISKDELTVLLLQQGRLQNEAEAEGQSEAASSHQIQTKMHDMNLKPAYDSDEASDSDFEP